MKYKPNFLIVGTAKSGTTSLVQYLKNHPKIFIPNIKELRYFSYDLLKDNGYKGPGDHTTKKIAIKTREAYLNCFDQSKKDVTAIGEASVETSYYFEHTIPKIKKELGDPKIIILLRDPVKRAISAYSHLIREQRETLSFEEALDKENWRKESGYEFIWSYVDSGLYYNQVKALKEAFTNLKVIVFEDFINNPNCHMKEVLSFLEVPEVQHVNHEQFNISGKPKNKTINYLLNKPLRIKSLLKFLLGERFSLKLKNKAQKLNLNPIEVSDELKQRLYKTFEEDISKVEILLNIDLNIWKKPYT